VNPEFLFKILYSLLCSVFPLVIYILSKRYIGEFYAFLASIYFMSNVTFLWTAFKARANIAMLFFAFAMMILFEERIDLLKKRILFIIFMASSLVSHYSNTYIFFFVMLGTFIGMEILSKKYPLKKVVSLTIVLLFFVLIFSWYSQVTETAFSQGVYFIKNTIRSLQMFFAEELRSQPAQLLLGKAIMQESIIYKIHFLLTWMTFTFIGTGILTLIRRYKEMSFLEPPFKKPNFLKHKFEVEYFMITLVCSGLLVAILALPYVSLRYGLGRSYPLASTILSVFFVIGGIILSKKLSFIKKPLLKRKSFTERRYYPKNNGKITSQQTLKESLIKNTSEVSAYLTILLVLVPYFLCATGAMYNIFGVPRDITLNSEGEQYDKNYIYDQESYSAKWLGEYGEKSKKIYADFFGDRRLISQGRIAPSQINYYWLSKHSYIIDGYIYLRYQNVMDGELLGHHSEMYNTTDYQDTFNKKNGIYDSGCSKIFV